jgi:DNA-binding transcriptional LysR family regulator
MAEEHGSDQWQGLEVRHLLALRTVAEEGSIGRAARKLRYGQSAISAQIAALERVVGARLFERHTAPRRVELTDAGRLLLEHAGAILSRVGAARADLVAASSTEPALRVGAFQSATIHVIPRILKTFTRQLPDTTLELYESGDDRELLQMVSQGTLDLAFAFLPLPEGPFSAEVLLADPYVVLAPREANLPAGQPISLAALRKLPFVLFDECSNQRRVEHALAAHGVELDVRLRAADTAAVHAMVSEGVGYGLVPRLAAQASERVAVYEVEAALPPRMTALAWHRDRQQRRAATVFIALAREIAKSQSPERANA